MASFGHEQAGEFAAHARTAPGNHGDFPSKALHVTTA